MHKLARALRRLLAYGQHVKPVTDRSGMFGWVNRRDNALSGFADDWRRYGLRTALNNLGWEIRDALR